ncbi:MAG: ParB/RepB/Spo0J family partition protein [Clostridia bacterium]|jgi:ParB family chromosome partitioning protein|nr:ParB/RepB/Spo0J family partition protein [Clostridia bacterium]
MSKKTGLGKGLDALFGGNNIEEEIKDTEVIENLKITQVEPNKNQPRRNFDEEALEELAESIKRYGVIQPIIVVKKEDYYEIVAGERRWRASKKAGLTTIPAIIRKQDERKNKEIALIENVQREDLNAYEKAVGIKELMQEYELTQQEVSEILGKSRSSIANTVRILNLDERVLELVKQGKLSEGHCRTLLAIEDRDKQYDMALRMLETGASVREAEKKVKAKKKMGPKDEKYEAIVRDIEDSFQGFFGTKVRLEPGKRKGKIVIEYASNEDLERILDIIK